MEKDYSKLVKMLLKHHRIRVNWWTASAIPLERLIECEEPATLETYLTALHEIGHVVLGHCTTEAIWRHECEAWDWAVEEARIQGVKVPSDWMKRIRGWCRGEMRRAAKTRVKVPKTWRGSVITVRR